MKLRRIVAIALATVLLLAVALYVRLSIFQPWYGTMVTTSMATTDVVIPRGTSLAEAAVKLEEAGIVSSALHFRLLARVLGDDRPIQAGEYRIPDEGWGDTLARMQRGDVLRRFLTIPEGLPSVLVAERLAAQPLLTGDFEPPPEASVLPDTYAFERGEPRAAVLARMQDAMRRAIAAEWARRKPSAPVSSPAQALILASIVEKETAIAAERRRVAGVYANRLRIGMKLQADPTVIYPVTKGRPLGRPIRRSELAADNGYNTYARAGLPAGPIANPGRAAIAATLNPERHDFLYFVADGRGGHVFARTLAEHNANHAKWRVIRAARASGG